MTGGIHIRPGTKATINGIDIERCGELAVGYARAVGRGRADMAVGLTDEGEIAASGGALLRKMRSKGYSREICRDALWAKIVNEAQQLKPGPRSA